VLTLRQGQQCNLTYLLSSAPLELQGQRMALVTLENISERKRAEEALQKSERELAAFFEDSPVGLLWTEPEGCIVRVNRAQADLLGCPTEEVLGRPITTFHVEPELQRSDLA
jgi:PAS domain-containing protein